MLENGNESKSENLDESIDRSGKRQQIDANAGTKMVQKIQQKATSDSRKGIQTPKNQLRPEKSPGVKSRLLDLFPACLFGLETTKISTKVVTKRVITYSVNLKFPGL